MTRCAEWSISEVSVLLLYKYLCDADLPNLHAFFGPFTHFDINVFVSKYLHTICHC